MELVNKAVHSQAVDMYYRVSGGWVQGFEDRFFWTDYDVVWYYSVLHGYGDSAQSCEQIVKDLLERGPPYAVRLQLMFLAQSNVDHGLMEPCFEFILRYVTYPDQALRSAALSAAGNVRARYPYECDAIMTRKSIPLATRLEIQGLRVHPLMGGTWVIALGRFVRQAVDAGDSDTVAFFRSMVGDIRSSRSLRDWFRKAFTRFLAITG